MVKKRISGQTIAIIILAILLLLTISFGGVYAFYTARSNKITSGKIIMANLKINIKNTSATGVSQIVITNGYNIVPGQKLENSPLTIENLSSVDIYLAVVYRINAVTETVLQDGTVLKEDVKDTAQRQCLGLGVEYINPIFPEYSTNKYTTNTKWVDYVFEAKNGDENANEVVVDDETGETKFVYRCLVSKITIPKETDETVIHEKELYLAEQLGNEYKQSSISFTFQAYAIGTETNFGFEDNDTTATRCEKIVSAIYEAQDETFLDLETNNI